MRVILFLFSITALHAQETINHSSVSGRVTDPSDAVVEGAQVTARHTATNLTNSARTDREGRFRFPYLKLGTYEIKVHHTGFADSVRTLNLTVGSAFDLFFALTIEAKETNLTVDADAAVLETSRSQVAGTVSQAEVAGLPLNGRNFLDLALVIPGVSPTNTGSNQLFAETSAVPGQGLSVGSQRNFSNNFIVDGLSANDDAAGLSGIFYGVDVVHEFQVVTTGGQAELGRALGGYINMVTKSGTNTMHGDLYGYFRNQRLNAANPLSNTKLPATQAQYGASLGGPIQRDRTFFFSNFEQRRLNQSGLVTIAPANVSAINTRLAAVGYRGPQIWMGLYSSPVDNTNLLGKVEHQFTRKDMFTVRYSLYDVAGINSRGAGGLNAATASSHLDNRDQTIAIGNILTLSPRTVNETRAQYTRSGLAAPASDPRGPAVNISGVATFGTSSGSPTGRDNNLYQVVDNLSHQVGPHALRAGVDFLFNDTTITYPRSVNGSYSFSSLANFLTGTYNNSGFTQTFGNSVVSETSPNLAFYAQDEWKVNAHLTLNMGVRYDLQYLKTIRTDTNNISPRAGFAWSPGASRRTVVRGSFGLFYDRVPLRAVANALLSSDNTTNLTAASQISLSLSPAQAGAPVFPDILPTSPTGLLVNFTTMNRDMQNAYSVQTGIEVERQLGERITVSAGYQRLRALHLIMSVNQNVPTCVAAGANNGCRPNAGYANNSQYSSLADSNYNALHVSFIQRPSRWGHYRISYAWSKAMDNVGEFFFSSPIDTRNIWLDYGRSDDDQRHRVVFDGAVHSHGFQLSGMLQYYSALPFNITSGVTTIQGSGGRPIVNGEFIPRNAGTGNDFFSVSTRLSRTFRIGDRLTVEGLAEAFNALNQRNNLTRNGTFGPGAYPSNPAANFGQVTAVNDPRSMQLALRLRF